MILAWQMRKDGLFAADCPCDSTLAGFPPGAWDGAEARHFEDAEREAFHAFMFAPGMTALLRAWTILSETSWQLQREADGPGVGRTQMHVLDAMAVIQRAFKSEFRKASR